MIHHQHFLAHARPIDDLNGCFGNRSVVAPNGIQQGRGFQACLRFLGVRVRLEQQRRAGAHLGNAVLDAHGTQRQAGVHVAVKADDTHRPAVPAARRVLMVFDELDGVLLRCPGHRDCPGVGKKPIEGVETLAQCPLDVIDRVYQARIEFELPPADDPHATRHAHPRLIIAIHVGAHGEFRFFLLGVQQFQYLCRVSDGILAPRNGAGYGTGLDAAPVDAYVHLR